jgi:hypothetical protein
MLLPLQEVRVKEGGEFVVRVPYQEPGAGMYGNEGGDGSIKPGIGMRIERRPRNHEPVIESTITQVPVNRTPTSGRRRRRRCAEFMNSRVYGGGVLGLLACVFCCPFIAILILWDWIAWNVPCFRY